MYIERGEIFMQIAVLIGRRLVRISFRLLKFLLIAAASLPGVNANNNIAFVWLRAVETVTQIGR